MDRAHSDPKVSCPIVCEEYMRASGFFFAINSETYLVTARHNILPTEVSKKTPEGTSKTIYSSELTLPTIDIFLRTQSGFTRHRYDIRETEVRQTPEVDIIGVPIDFDPESHGYRVWTDRDVVEGKAASDELSVIGFDGESFPNGKSEYDIEMYCNNIEEPRILHLDNPLPDLESRELGLELVAIDKTHEGGYRGLSGSPVLGDKFAGIHIADMGTQSLEHDYGDIRRIIYLRSAILPKLLG